MRISLGQANTYLCFCPWLILNYCLMWPYQEVLNFLIYCAFQLLRPCHFVPSANFSLLPFIITVLSIYPQLRLFEKNFHFNICMLPILIHFWSFLFHLFYHPYAVKIFFKSSQGCSPVFLYVMNYTSPWQKTKILAHKIFLSLYSSVTLYTSYPQCQVLGHSKTNAAVDIFVDKCGIYDPSMTTTRVTSLRACAIW